MNHKYKTLFCVLFTALFFCACGKNEKLTSYEEQMETFFVNIGEIHEEMNSVDMTDQEAAETTMLGLLDALKAEFDNLAKLEVPKEFISVETLADEAAENMTQAVALYHQLFENETYDTAIAQAASEYYSRANVRFQYIISILHGEIPEGENVTITMDNEKNEEPASSGEAVMETHGEIQTENPLAETEQSEGF